MDIILQTFLHFFVFLCIAKCSKCCLSETKYHHHRKNEDEIFNSRSKYEQKSAYEGFDGTFNPRLKQQSDKFYRGNLLNGTKYIETCQMTQMFQSCSDNCKDINRDLHKTWVRQTGRNCHELKCITEAKCAGILCKCCRKIMCNIETFALTGKNRDETTINVSISRTKDFSFEANVKNCSKTGLDDCQINPRLNNNCTSDKRQLETFLEMTCSSVICRRFRSCEGLKCDCCELHQCLGIKEKKTSLDFNGLHHEDKSLVDLNAVLEEGRYFQDQVDYDKDARINMTFVDSKPLVKDREFFSNLWKYHSKSFSTQFPANEALVFISASVLSCAIVC